MYNQFRLYIADLFFLGAKSHHVDWLNLRLLIISGTSTVVGMLTEGAVGEAYALGASAPASTLLFPLFTLAPCL